MRACASTCLDPYGGLFIPLSGTETYLDALAAARAPEWSVVIDAAGWHLGLFDSVFARFLYRTAKTDGAHYPELLRLVLVVNAPVTFAKAWRVIAMWIDEETRAKVDFISIKRPDEARAKLRRLVEPSQLPAQYGGTAPPLHAWPERAGLCPAE